MKPEPILSALILAVVVATSASHQTVAQTASFEPQTPLAASAPTAVPSLVPYSGAAIANNGKPLTGDVDIIFQIYKDEQGGEALWTETQTVVLDSSGRYKVQLGAASPNGLPSDLFLTGEARWLEVQIAGQKPQPRALIASVPYALKAVDATTLAGLPASAYALAGAKTATVATALTTPTAISNADVAVTTPGGTAGYFPVFTGASTIGDSILFASSTGIGVGDFPNSSAVFDVNGKSIWRGLLNVSRAGNATAATGFDSYPILLQGSVYNSTTKVAEQPVFQLQVEPTGNNTASPGATFNLLAGTGGASETGLYFNTNGTVHFAAGQTFPGTGSGTITRVTPGTALTGGGTSGNVTLNLDTTKAPLLAASNHFTGTQSVTGALTASGSITTSGQLISTTTTGTAPLKVTSTTEVPNLNASLLGGSPASAFATHGSNTFAGNEFINGTGTAGDYGLTVNQPSQTGVLVESSLTGVGAGIDLQTTGSGGKQWEILATGNSASQGTGKFNIRDINTGTDVFTISSTDAVTVGGVLTLQGNVTDSSTFITSSNVVGGWSGNAVASGATGATIAGGGESTADGGPNTVSADFGTVGGGENNTASAEASTVAGGYANSASGFGSTVAGGGINTASGSTSAVPGGYVNIASGAISFAAGFVAQATDSGSFVWCQQDGHACTSSGTNSFVVSVNGPIYFYDGPNGQGCYLSAGSGSWTCSSDRNLKDNIVSIDPRSVLDRVSQMPISQWNMKADFGGHKHIGPMAQDFYAAFGLGDTDKYIAQGDAQGVALASIQGLYQMVQEKLQEKDEEIRSLEFRLSALEERTMRSEREKASPSSP